MFREIDSYIFLGAGLNVKKKIYCVALMKLQGQVIRKLVVYSGMRSHISLRCLLTFQWKLLPPSSTRKMEVELYLETLENVCHTT
jgi:hypothetical protein